jgi:putative endonuclease
MKNEMIYILLLEHDKIYIGRTSNFERRYDEHINGKGSWWTQKHKPVKILDKYICSNSFEEDTFVKIYMSEYGIENVRGGSYVQDKLDDNQIELLQKEIRFAKNQCVNCGESDHFVKNCNVDIFYKCEICLKEFKTKFDCSVHIESHNKINKRKKSSKCCNMCVIC